MNLDEIRLIDREPFDLDMLEDFYGGGYPNMDYATTVLRLYLFHWYFVKFNEIYGTDISLLDEPTIMVGKVTDDAFQVLDPCDILTEYEYKCNELLYQIAGEAGFELIDLEMDDMGFSEEFWEKSDEEKKAKFQEWFANQDDDWQAIIWENRNNIKDTHCYLECGSILIFRNQNIGAYKLLCKTYSKIMKEHFKAETRMMDKVLKVMEYPLFLQNIHASGDNGSYHYIYIDMGSDGYHFLSSSALNFHWVINCIVFKHLFEDLKTKLEQLVDIYPELRYTA